MDDLKKKIAKLEEEKKALNRRVSAPAYCQAYINGGCFDENCKNMHVEKAEVDKRKAAAKAMAAKKKKEKRAQSAGP